MILLLALTVLLAPAAPRDDKELFFPVAVGSKWVYRTVTKNNPEEFTEVITESEAGDVYTIIKIGSEMNGKMTTVRQLSVSSQGLFLGKEGKKAAAPLDAVIKFPLKKDETWTVEIGKNAHRKYVIKGEEEVVVPAGKFKTIRVDISILRDGQPFTEISEWYAPRTGMVKSFNPKPRNAGAQGAGVGVGFVRAWEEMNLFQRKSSQTWRIWRNGRAVDRLDGIMPHVSTKTW